MADRNTFYWTSNSCIRPRSHCRRQGYTDKKKSVILIRGGPGTGKSVIALNLLAALSRQGLNAHYVTGQRRSQPPCVRWSETGRQSRSATLTSYSAAEFNVIDVMVCDEAHRIRVNSNNRFTPQPSDQTSLQIEELIHASKVAVFLIDDKQVVKLTKLAHRVTCWKRLRAWVQDSRLPT